MAMPITMKKLFNHVNTSNIGIVSSNGPGADESNGRDAYFIDAGRLIIDKDKASIGMLQRAFKIGFNRAARIMDQLCEAGLSVAKREQNRAKSS